MSSAPPTVEASVIIPCHNSTRTLSYYASQLDVMDAEHRRLSSTETLPVRERYWVLSRQSANPPKGAARVA